MNVLMLAVILKHVGAVPNSEFDVNAFPPPIFCDINAALHYSKAICQGEGSLPAILYAPSENLWPLTTLSLSAAGTRGRFVPLLNSTLL